MNARRLVDRIFGPSPPPREERLRPTPRPLSTWLADLFDSLNCWVANQACAHARAWQSYVFTYRDELESTKLRPRYEKDQQEDEHVLE